MKTVLRLALLGALAITCLAGTVSAAAAAECPNEALRDGPSANLPDCRAYEQVTPVEKGGQDAPLIPSNVFAPVGTPQAAVSGDGVAYSSLGAFSGSVASSPFYVAARGTTAGWSSTPIVPPQSTSTTFVCAPSYEAYSPELSNAVLSDGQGQQFGCGTDQPPLVSGEPQGVNNLFLRDISTGAYQLINVTPSGVTPADAAFEGGSPDLTHVVFTEAAPLTLDAPSTGAGLYEWTGGTVSALALIPRSPETSCSGTSCTPVAYAELGNWKEQNVANAVSGDGSHVFFQVGGELYLRHGDATTLVGSGKFMAAASDGSSVVFEYKKSLYRYVTATGQLTDLTVDTSDPGGAEVEGLLGASDDVSNLYVIAKGVLTTTPNSHGEAAAAGQANLYLLHGTTRTFIATLASNMGFYNPGDSFDWVSHQPEELAGAQVTADGMHLAFVSERSLTGYDNTVASGTSCGEDGFGQALPSACKEVYVYNAKSNILVCASCNPTGARPTGPSFIPGQKMMGSETHLSNFSLARALSGDGSRLFFDSADGILPTDSNGEYDVYEWEAAGTGGCAESLTNNRSCIYLISSGHSSDESLFVDASESGDDVFFTTREQLVGQDDDELRDLYDARVDGGLASQGLLPSGQCAGWECRSPFSTPTSMPLAASVTFLGAANLRVARNATSRKRSRNRTNALRHRRLRRSLKRCNAKFQHNRQARRMCKRAARRRIDGARASFMRANVR